MRLKKFKFRDVATGRTSTIKAMSPVFAIRKYERRRKGKYKPNWEFID